MPLGAHKATLFGVAGVSTGSVVLLSSQTASDSASLTITSGIDSTYTSYILKFYYFYPDTDYSNLQINFSTDSGSNYGVAITSTYFYAGNYDSDSFAAFAYDTSADLADSGDYQDLVGNTGNDGSKGASGELYLFNPASTTYVKHFYSRFSSWRATDLLQNSFAGGYCNTTSAINAISVKFASGNITAGKLKMWGVK